MSAASSQLLRIVGVHAMIDRQHDQILIECDACDSVFEPSAEGLSGPAAADWSVVWTVAKRLRSGAAGRQLRPHWWRCPPPGQRLAGGFGRSDLLVDVLIRPWLARHDRVIHVKFDRLLTDVRPRLDHTLELFKKAS